MRRTLAVVMTATLLSLAVSASATDTENYKDKFSSIGWGGSDGSLNWSGSWNENNDDGDEKKGNVRVVSSGNCASGNCMRFSALTTLLSGWIGATRAADTSDLEDASLCFDLKATSSLLGSELLVQVNGGEGWVTVAQYQLGAAQTDHPTIDVSEYRSEDFQVRFRFSGALLSSEVFIDNVEILGTILEEPTTTTTTIAGTTTTTVGGTTTTSQPATTTTTRPRATTTTTEPDANSSTSTSTTTPARSTSTTAPGPDPQTTTTSHSSSSASTTTTTSSNTIGVTTVGPGSGGDGTPPEGSGIRAAARGLQANFQGDLFGEVRTVAALNGVDLQADYKMAVEVIRSSWVWMALLGLLIGWAVVKGLDRRRDHSTPESSQ